MRRLAAALAAAAAWSSLAVSSAPPSPAPERRTLRLRYTPARAGGPGPGPRPREVRRAAGDAPLSPAAPARFRRTATTNVTLRAEVRAPDGSLLALTNPVYVATEDRAPARSSNRLK